MDQRRKGVSRFSQEKTPEKIYVEGGVRRELIRLVEPNVWLG
jgi:hypothetical protein